MLDPCKVDAMLEDLNQSNDFSGFVRGMRAVFVELARSEKMEQFPE